MSKKEPTAKLEGKGTTKQLKILLSINEHAVVTAAANMQGMQVGDYMKRAVIDQAKIDAKKMNAIIDAL
ncbi:hypothetical protein [Allorhodopirellula heiligendammensis]|uniref:DUF1778 domain-containing protein n=1 Tax=Allorhodopirellula heiligendammensis TaxID=2714739 RepID=A0A5C6BUF5_9BACT|nr:hypothetical protein [Allorhodopirellula heiligendammensis]TWU15482.1 hypothetical protein Poly21_26780 [Allorhodopirellula heiligendammensis]